MLTTTLVALTFEEAQKKVADLMKDRILVGHAIKNDLECLLIGHPRINTRDTSRFPPFRKLSKGRTPGLKKLAKELLGIDIQSGSHSSVCIPVRNCEVLMADMVSRLRMPVRVCCCTGEIRTNLSDCMPLRFRRHRHRRARAAARSQSQRRSGDRL